MTRFNVTTESKYAYVSSNTGATGQCQQAMLQLTKPGETVRLGSATYVYPFNSETTLMKVRSSWEMAFPQECCCCLSVTSMRASSISS